MVGSALWLSIVIVVYDIIIWADVHVQWIPCMHLLSNAPDPARRDTNYGQLRQLCLLIKQN